MQFISLLTDFGIQQEYVGVCKAVILRICPGAQIVDVSHTVPSFDIGEGAFMLRNFVKYSPVGVHVAVIDPGVGTKRQGIVVETERGDFLVGPDNGVLMGAADYLKLKRVVALENKEYMLETVSSSFHGRDVFAPAAAYLANGVPLTEFGKVLPEKELVTAFMKGPTEDEEGIHGRIVRIDRFGNVQVNIDAGRICGKNVKIRVHKKEVVLPFLKTFGEAAPGELLMYEDSDGLLTIAQNQGHAAATLGVTKGTKVLIVKDI
jgi:S-adenosylmethionine hydrolase